jgi:hypothetical protein
MPDRLPPPVVPADSLVPGPQGPSAADADAAVRQVVAEGPAGAVLLVDSITQLTAADAGAWVVTGSHGGVSAARYALECPLALVVFNDAGVGKDGAGVAALERLQARGRAAATVSHASARIGDARDAWACGVLSRVNAAAAVLGLTPGQPVRAAVLQAVGHTPR